jgi:hypothetical protein
MLSIFYAEYQALYAECILHIITLNFVMLSVIMLNGMAPSLESSS